MARSCGRASAASPRLSPRPHAESATPAMPSVASCRKRRLSTVIQHPCAPRLVRFAPSNTAECQEATLGRRAPGTPDFGRVGDHVPIVVGRDMSAGSFEVLVPEITNRGAARGADIGTGDYDADSAQLRNALAGGEVPDPAVS